VADGLLKLSADSWTGQLLSSPARADKRRYLTDCFAIETVIADLHPWGESAKGRKVLDSETDSFGSRAEASIFERLPLAGFATGNEQLRWRAVIESHGKHALTS
jgi:hypothetical protein